MAPSRGRASRRGSTRHRTRASTASWRPGTGSHSSSSIFEDAVPELWTSDGTADGTLRVATLEGLDGRARASG